MVQGRSDPPRLLVFTDGEVLGDGVNKLPLLLGLRAAWPDAHITWAAGDRTVYNSVLAPLARKALDDVVEGVKNEVRFSLALIRRPWIPRNWDVVIDTQTRLWQSLAVRRIQHRVYLGRAAGWCLSARRPRKGTDGRATTVVEALRELFCLAGRQVELMPLPPPPEACLRAAAMLLPPGPRYVGLVPGAGGVEKRWPVGAYVTLGESLRARGDVPVCFPGPDEAEIASALRLGLPTARFPEAELTASGAAMQGPEIVRALAGRLAAAVSNDCGAGHLLAAGGCPLLTLFTDRRRAAKFKPHAAFHSALCADDFGGRMCDIPPPVVLTELDALLARVSALSMKGPE